MGNDLDRTAKIIASTLGGNDSGINLTGGDAGAFRTVDVHEPLVVAEVQVRLSAIFGDENFAMLKGIHRSSIDVDVGVKLDRSNGITAIPEKPAKTRGCDSFADRTNNAARNENVLGHVPCNPTQKDEQAGTNAPTLRPRGFENYTRKCYDENRKRVASSCGIPRTAILKA